MNKGALGFSGGVALVAAVGILWARQGGLAQSFQEKNAAEWAAPPAQSASVSAFECAACHPSEGQGLRAAAHRTVECRNCHDRSAEHFQGTGKPTVDTSAELCGSCHSQVIGRPAGFPQVDLDQHAGGTACATCHQAHGPALAGSSRCQACHAPVYKEWASAKHQTVGCVNCHGSAVRHVLGQGRPVVDTSPQLCISCHGATQEQRAALPQIDPRTHAGQLACSLCHGSH